MGTSPRALLTGIGYLALFVLGAVQGVIGSFRYGRAPAPLIAILLILILFATCVLAGWGMRTYSAGILPALGWVIASFILAMPRSVLAAAVELPDDSWFARNKDLSVSVPDDQVTTEIDATPYLPAKLAAMAAHETQITVDGEFYALSNELGQRALGTEYYTLLAGSTGQSGTSGPSGPSSPSGPSGRPDGEGGVRRAGGPFERDLFAR